jgi:hypothetical protein
MKIQGMFSAENCSPKAWKTLKNFLQIGRESFSGKDLFVLRNYEQKFNFLFAKICGNIADLQGMNDIHYYVRQ